MFQENLFATLSIRLKLNPVLPKFGPNLARSTALFENTCCFRVVYISKICPRWWLCFDLSALILRLQHFVCYGTELVIATICCFIAAQEKRSDLHRSDLQNPLKINFAAVFELKKIDELKTARNGKNKLKLTQE